jgi:hypothetical protein
VIGHTKKGAFQCLLLPQFPSCLVCNLGRIQDCVGGLSGGTMDIQSVCPFDP